MDALDGDRHAGRPFFDFILEGEVATSHAGMAAHCAQLLRRCQQRDQAALDSVCNELASLLERGSLTDGQRRIAGLLHAATRVAAAASPPSTFGAQVETTTHAAAATAALETAVTAVDRATAYFLGCLMRRSLDLEPESPVGFQAHAVDGLDAAAVCDALGAMCVGPHPFQSDFALRWLAKHRPAVLHEVASPSQSPHTRAVVATIMLHVATRHGAKVFDSCGVSVPALALQVLRDVRETPAGASEEAAALRTVALRLLCVPEPAAEGSRDELYRTRDAAELVSAAAASATSHTVSKELFERVIADLTSAGSLDRAKTLVPGMLAIAAALAPAVGVAVATVAAAGVKKSLLPVARCNLLAALAAEWEGDFSKQLAACALRTFVYEFRTHYSHMTFAGFADGVLEDVAAVPLPPAGGFGIRAGLFVSANAPSSAQQGAWSVVPKVDWDSDDILKGKYNSPSVHSFGLRGRNYSRWAQVSLAADATQQKQPTVLLGLWAAALHAELAELIPTGKICDLAAEIAALLTFRAGAFKASYASPFPPVDPVGPSSVASCPVARAVFFDALANAATHAVAEFELLNVPAPEVTSDDERRRLYAALKLAAYAVQSYAAIGATTATTLSTHALLPFRTRLFETVKRLETMMSGKGVFSLPVRWINDQLRNPLWSWCGKPENLETLKTASDLAATTARQTAGHETASRHVIATWLDKLLADDGEAVSVLHILSQNLRDLEVDPDQFSIDKLDELKKSVSEQWENIFGEPWKRYHNQYTRACVKPRPGQQPSELASMFLRAAFTDEHCLTLGDPCARIRYALDKGWTLLRRFGKEGQIDNGVLSKLNTSRLRPSEEIDILRFADSDETYPRLRDTVGDMLGFAFVRRNTKRIRDALIHINIDATDVCDDISLAKARELSLLKLEEDHLVLLEALRNASHVAAFLSRQGSASVQGTIGDDRFDSAVHALVGAESNPGTLVMEVRDVIRELASIAREDTAYALLMQLERILPVLFPIAYYRNVANKSIPKFCLLIDRSRELLVKETSELSVHACLEMLRELNAAMSVVEDALGRQFQTESAAVRKLVTEMQQQRVAFTVEVSHDAGCVLSLEVWDPDAAAPNPAGEAAAAVQEQGAWKSLPFRSEKLERDVLQRYLQQATLIFDTQRAKEGVDATDRYGSNLLRIWDEVERTSGVLQGLFDLGHCDFYPIRERFVVEPHNAAVATAEQPWLRAVDKTHHRRTELLDELARHEKTVAETVALYPVLSLVPQDSLVRHQKGIFVDWKITLSALLGERVECAGPTPAAGAMTLATLGRQLTDFATGLDALRQQAHAGNFATAAEYLVYNGVDERQAPPDAAAAPAGPAPAAAAGQGAVAAKDQQTTFTLAQMIQRAFAGGLQCMQFIECTPDTTRATINSFCQRIRHFPHLRFVVFAAHRLVQEARVALCSFIKAQLQARSRMRLLVCLIGPGAEFAALRMSRVGERTPIGGRAPEAPSASAKFYIGDSSSGKTQTALAAAEEMVGGGAGDGNARVQRLYLHDDRIDHAVSQFIKKFKKPEVGVPVVYVGVSSYALGVDVISNDSRHAAGDANGAKDANTRVAVTRLSLYLALWQLLNTRSYLDARGRMYTLPRDAAFFVEIAATPGHDPTALLDASLPNIVKPTAVHRCSFDPAAFIPAAVASEYAIDDVTRDRVGLALLCAQDVEVLRRLRSAVPAGTPVTFDCLVELLPDAVREAARACIIALTEDRGGAPRAVPVGGWHTFRGWLRMVERRVCPSSASGAVGCVDWATATCERIQSAIDEAGGLSVGRRFRTGPGVAAMLVPNSHGILLRDTPSADSPVNAAVLAEHAAAVCARCNIPPRPCSQWVLPYFTIAQLFSGAGAAAVGGEAQPQQRHGGTPQDTADVYATLADAGFVVGRSTVRKMMLVLERQATRSALIVSSSTGVGKTTLLDTMDRLQCALQNRGTLHLLRGGNGKHPLCIEKLLALLSARGALDGLPPQDLQPCAEGAPSEADVALLFQRIITNNQLNLDERVVEERINQHAKVPFDALRQVLDELCNELGDVHSFREAKVRLTNAEGCNRGWRGELMRFFDALRHSPHRPRTEKVMVHPGLTAADVNAIMSSVVERAERLARRGLGLTLFFDELNTSSIPGYFTTLIMDRYLEGGHAVPLNVHFIAAINPHRQDGSAPQQVGLPEESYNVLRLPDTMQSLVQEFDLMDDADVDDYVAAAIEIPFPDKTVLFERHPEVKRAFTQILVSAHNAARGREGGCISQRDIQRAIAVAAILADFFGASRPRAEAGHAAPRPYTAAVLAVYLCYHCRIDPGPRRERPAVELWQSMTPEVQDKLYEEVVGTDGAGCGAAFKYMRRIFLDQTEDVAARVRAFAACAMRQVVNKENFFIDKGIALTNALVENVFLVLLSAVSRSFGRRRAVAVGIIGRPGRGKTLSVRIVNDNMKGPNSPTAFFKRFRSLQVLWLQGSEAVTAQDVSMLFDRARQLQEAQSQATGSAILLCFDEAGLPESEMHVMKAVHGPLDAAVVPFVCLSNRKFDPANQNRMLTVRRELEDDSDALRLTRGSLRLPEDEPADGQLTVRDLKARALRNAFQRISQADPPRADATNPAAFRDMCSRYHSREFIHLCRYLSAHNQALTGFTPKDLRMGLEYNNTGGTRGELVLLCDVYFNEVRAELEAHGMVPPREAWVFDASMLRAMDDIVRESFARTHTDSGHEQHSSAVSTQPRYKMLIDPMNDYSCSQRVLESLRAAAGPSGVKQQTFVDVYVSDFPSDQCATEDARVVARLRHCMEEGHHAVVYNPIRIIGYLFDLLNQNFTNHRTKVAGSNEWKRVRKAVLAIGAETHSCVVHDSFRITFVLRTAEAGDLEQRAAPFMSRHEKYRLEHAPHQLPQEVVRSVKQFVHEFVGAHNFESYDPDATIQSAVGALDRRGYHVTMPPSLPDDCAAAFRINVALLETCAPAALVAVAGELAHGAEYLQAVLHDQEHFSLSARIAQRQAECHSHDQRPLYVLTRDVDGLRQLLDPTVESTFDVVACDALRRLEDLRKHMRDWLASSVKYRTGRAGKIFVIERRNGDLRFVNLVRRTIAGMLKEHAACTAGDMAQCGPKVAVVVCAPCALPTVLDGDYVTTFLDALCVAESRATTLLHAALKRRGQRDDIDMRLALDLALDAHIEQFLIHDDTTLQSTIPALSADAAPAKRFYSPGVTQEARQADLKQVLEETGHGSQIQPAIEAAMKRDLWLVLQEVAMRMAKGESTLHGTPLLRAFEHRVDAESRTAVSTALRVLVRDYALASASAATQRAARAPQLMPKLFACRVVRARALGPNDPYTPTYRVPPACPLNPWLHALLRDVAGVVREDRLQTAMERVIALVEPDLAQALPDLALFDHTGDAPAWAGGADVPAWIREFAWDVIASSTAFRGEELASIVTAAMDVVLAEARKSTAASAGLPMAARVAVALVLLPRVKAMRTVEKNAFAVGLARRLNMPLEEGWTGRDATTDALTAMLSKIAQLQDSPHDAAAQIQQFARNHAVASAWLLQSRGELLPPAVTQRRNGHEDKDLEDDQQKRALRLRTQALMMFVRVLLAAIPSAELPQHAAAIAEAFAQKLEAEGASTGGLLVELVQDLPELARQRQWIQAGAARHVALSALLFYLEWLGKTKHVASESDFTKIAFGSISSQMPVTAFERLLDYASEGNASEGSVDGMIKLASGYVRHEDMANTICVAFDLTKPAVRWRSSAHAPLDAIFRCLRRHYALIFSAEKQLATACQSYVDVTNRYAVNPEASRFLVLSALALAFLSELPALLKRDPTPPADVVTALKGLSFMANDTSRPHLPTAWHKMLYAAVSEAGPAVGPKFVEALIAQGFRWARKLEAPEYLNLGGVKRHSMLAPHLPPFCIDAAHPLHQAYTVAAAAVDSGAFARVTAATCGVDDTAAITRVLLASVLFDWYLAKAAGQDEEYAHTAALLRHGQAALGWGDVQERIVKWLCNPRATALDLATRLALQQDVVDLLRVDTADDCHEASLGRVVRTASFAITVGAGCDAAAVRSQWQQLLTNPGVLQGQPAVGDFYVEPDKPHNMKHGYDCGGRMLQHLQDGDDVSGYFRENTPLTQTRWRHGALVLVYDALLCNLVLYPDQAFAETWWEKVVTGNFVSEIQAPKLVTRMFIAVLNGRMVHEGLHTAEADARNRAVAARAAMWGGVNGDGYTVCTISTTAADQHLDEAHRTRVEASLDAMWQAAWATMPAAHQWLADLTPNENAHLKEGRRMVLEDKQSMEAPVTRVNRADRLLFVDSVFGEHGCRWLRCLPGILRLYDLIHVQCAQRFTALEADSHQLAALRKGTAAKIVDQGIAAWNDYHGLRKGKLDFACEGAAEHNTFFQLEPTTTLAALLNRGNTDDQSRGLMVAVIASIFKAHGSNLRELERVRDAAKPPVELDHYMSCDDGTDTLREAAMSSFGVEMACGALDRYFARDATALDAACYQWATQGQVEKWSPCHQAHAILQYWVPLRQIPGTIDCSHIVYEFKAEPRRQCTPAEVETYIADMANRAREDGDMFHSEKAARLCESARKQPDLRASLPVTLHDLAEWLSLEAPQREKDPLRDLADAAGSVLGSTIANLIREALEPEVRGWHIHALITSVREDMDFHFSQGRNRLSHPDAQALYDREADVVAKLDVALLVHDAREGVCQFMDDVVATQQELVQCEQSIGTKAGCLLNDPIGVVLSDYMSNDVFADCLPRDLCFCHAAHLYGMLTQLLGRAQARWHQLAPKDRCYREAPAPRKQLPPAPMSEPEPEIIPVSPEPRPKPTHLSVFDFDPERKPPPPPPVGLRAVEDFISRVVASREDPPQQRAAVVAVAAKAQAAARAQPTLPPAPQQVLQVERVDMPSRIDNAATHPMIFLEVLGQHDGLSACAPSLLLWDHRTRGIEELTLPRRKSKFHVRDFEASDFPVSLEAGCMLVDVNGVALVPPATEGAAPPSEHVDPALFDFVAYVPWSGASAHCVLEASIAADSAPRAWWALRGTTAGAVMRSMLRCAAPGTAAVALQALTAAEIIDPATPWENVPSSVRVLYLDNSAYRGVVHCTVGDGEHKLLLSTTTVRAAATAFGVTMATTDMAAASLADVVTDAGGSIDVPTLATLRLRGPGGCVLAHQYDPITAAAGGLMQVALAALRRHCPQCPCLPVLGTLPATWRLREDSAGVFELFEDWKVDIFMNSVRRTQRAALALRLDSPRTAADLLQDFDVSPKAVLIDAARCHSALASHDAVDPTMLLTVVVADKIIDVFVGDLHAQFASWARVAEVEQHFCAATRGALCLVWRGIALARVGSLGQLPICDVLEVPERRQLSFDFAYTSTLLPIRVEATDADAVWAALERLAVKTTRRVLIDIGWLPDAAVTPFSIACTEEALESALTPEVVQWLFTRPFRAAATAANAEETPCDIPLYVDTVTRRIRVAPASDSLAVVAAVVAAVPTAAALSGTEASDYDYRVVVHDKVAEESYEWLDMGRASAYPLY